MSGKYTILVVEDDIKLRYTLEDFLISNGFVVLTAENGEVALELFFAQKQYINLVLLDGMLPVVDGFDVLKTIRKESDVPVIMLSARESEEQQLRGFKLGADNYITKPFLLSVLKEHINALLARTLKESKELIRGALRFNLDIRKVYLNEREIETTPKEYETLLYLVRNQNKVLKRDNILDEVWGVDYYGDYRTVDTIIKQLRKKLTVQYPYIKSVYGVGYYFEV